MIAAYKEVHGKNIKQVTGKDMKLTEGTDPTKILKLSFLVNDGIACPSFLPMEPSDCQLSANVIFANLMNPDIPMSELMRKEFYYDCIQNFRQAMNVNPALIKMEMVNLMKFYDSQYMIEKTEEEKAKSYNFTQGDYNRVTCMLYLIVRRLIKNTVLLMTQDNKIRM